MSVSSASPSFCPEVGGRRDCPKIGQTRCVAYFSPPSLSRVSKRLFLLEARSERRRKEEEKTARNVTYLMIGEFRGILPLLPPLLFLLPIIITHVRVARQAGKLFHSTFFKPLVFSRLSLKLLLKPMGLFLLLDTGHIFFRIGARYDLATLTHVNRALTPLDIKNVGGFSFSPLHQKWGERGK